MEQITWFEKANGQQCEGQEVAIRIYIPKKVGEAPYTIIVFYDGSSNKITKRDYVKVGVARDRIYFDESMSGFKLMKNGKTGRRLRLPSVLEEFVGQYKLQFDAESGYWFVQKKGGQR